MTRVSQEHLDARRRQILDAARRCFLRNGFHATSMQDVLTEAELSAGAVYRYFKGKDAIIAAVVAETLQEVTTAFEDDGEGPPPPLEDVLDLALSADKAPLSRSEESARMMVQVWSEAMRSPDLRTELKEVMDGARSMFADLVTRHQRAGTMPAEASAEQVAAVVMAVIDGFMVQWAVDGHADTAAFRSGLRALMSGGPGRGD